MSTLPKWRQNLFRVSVFLFLIGTVALPVAAFRSHRLRVTHSYGELSFWIFGGFGAPLIALFLLPFGSGRKRLALIGATLVELYLWFSYATLMVQLT
jgi:hypothetical protein